MLGVALATALLALVACEVLGDFDEFERSKGEKTGCDALPLWKDNQRGGALIRVDLAGADAGCSWIDQTEVTVDAYGSWLNSPPPDLKFDPKCGWKTAPSDPVGDAPGNPCPDKPIIPYEADPWAGDKPIRCVDWCDAEAYCRTAGTGVGKPGRLCNIGQGATSVTQVPWEWEDACSDSRTRTFPYGNQPLDGVCNVGKSKGGVLAVKTKQECTTPSGVFDMIGNVWEWVRQCEPLPDSGGQNCLVKGGSYDSDVGWHCNGTLGRPQSYRGADTGFRCCRTLETSEELGVDGG